MTKIRIFHVEPASSVLKGLQSKFEEYNIHAVDRIEEADIIISSQISSLKGVTAQRGQTKLQWTNEIRWSIHSSQTAEVDGETIQIMNAFSGDVFFDPFHFLWVAKYQTVAPFTATDYDVRAQDPRPSTYCMASNHGTGNPFLVNGEDLDLYRYRRRIALYGYKHDVCDIYGAGWPEGISKSDGRDGMAWSSWEEEKLAVAKPYFFNLCFENTNSNYYVTEKFWHSLMTRSIPIYVPAKTGLADYFSLDCLIDCSEEKSPEQIFLEIERIGKLEYIERVNTLISEFNQVAGTPSLLQNSRERMQNNVVRKLKSLRP